MNFTAIKDDIIDFFISDPFTALVNLISFIGLIFTIQVYLNLKKIEKFYMFTGRVPDLIKTLGDHASTLSDHLNDFNGNISQIELELVRIKVPLKSLEKKTDGELRKSISGLLELIGTYEPEIKGDAGARKIYREIIGIQAEIVELNKDQKWKVS